MRINSIFFFNVDFVGLNGTVNSNGLFCGPGKEPEITKNFVPGNYVYDLEIYTSENVYRLIQGKFTVTSEVTR